MADELKNVIAQSLECPVCQNTFKDPKILSCSHTYCKACLDNLLECYGNDQTLRCPVCRAETQVPNQDVSKLPANLALKSLIEDVKHQYQFCTHCKSEENPKAVVYCQDCGKYLCISCQNIHSKWGDFSDHEVLYLSEVASGKLPIHRYRKCRKHPKEDEECFCSECRRFACFRCSVMEHAHEGHRVIDASVYESNHLKSVDQLKSMADRKRSCFQKYVDFIDEHKDRVSNVKKQCIYHINKAYEESVRQLAEKRELLFDEVKDKTEEAVTKLDRVKKEAQKKITHMTTVTEMVTNLTKIPLEMDALAAHDTLCQELQEVLRQDDPDYTQPRISSKKGQCVAFERNVGLDELSLGKIVYAVAKDIALPAMDSMNAMVPTPDGRMAVGCCTGGVEIFSADGQLQQTVLKDVKIHRLGFLSDGRFVVLDSIYKITLFTPECEKLDVSFETLSNDEAWYGSLSVDNDDQIHVGYSKAKKIQVFSSAGGKAIREIPCKGWQISCYNDIIITSCGVTIKLIDNLGTVKHLHKVSTDIGYLYAAATQENSILIALVKYDIGFVCIDEYTNELKHVKNIIFDHKIEKSKRKWYYLQQFQSGEIAFCTPDRLYIFP